MRKQWIPGAPLCFFSEYWGTRLVGSYLHSHDLKLPLGVSAYQPTNQGSAHTGLGQPQPLLRFLTTSHSTELLKYQCLADRYYGIMVRGQTNPSLHSKIGTFLMCLYRVIGF